MSQTPERDPLSACERERLDRIGAIQPFGALLGGAEGDERLTFASRDASRWLGLGEAVAPPLGWPLGELVPLGLADFPERLGEKRVVCDLLRSPQGHLDGILCRGESGWTLELEPAILRDWALPVADPMLRRLFQIPHGEDGLGDYAQGLAEAIGRHTGYDRVMVYRFLPDGCGETIAESAERGPVRYLGLRFPASDIPEIARTLYRRNSHRQIPDIGAPPEPLVALPGVEPDLTYSDLRAVSPVHLQYLANMGVGASLSFSIRVGGLLWGLVACHHERPRQLPLRVREHCVELAHTFALGVGSYQANRRLGRLGNADAWVERVAELARDVELGRRLPALLDPVLLEPLGATGAALVWDGGLRTFGVAPPREAIAAIDGWLRSAERGPVLATDRLAAESGLDLGQDQVAGLLAVQSGLAGELGERRFYWFRPEQPRTLSWAGDPAKPVDAGSGGLGVGPRRSFELWVETTRGHSAPWDELDLVLARKLRILLLRDFRVGGPESG